MNTHQVKVIKYFGGLVHLCHRHQDLVVYVLLVGSQFDSYPGLQSRVHLHQQRKTTPSLTVLISLEMLLFRKNFVFYHFRREVVQVFCPHDVPQMLFDESFIGNSIRGTFVVQEKLGFSPS